MSNGDFFDAESAADIINFSDAFNNGMQKRAPGDPRVQDIQQALQMPRPTPVNERLLRVRADNPYLPIMIFPSYVNTLVWSAAGNKIMPIPSGAKYAWLSASAAVYLTRSSNNNPSGLPLQTDNGDGSFLLSNNCPPILYYVEDIQCFECYSGATGAILSAAFYFQQ